MAENQTLVIYQYSDNRPTYAHRYLRPVLKKMLLGINNNFPGKKPYVLDMGCGNGEFCNFLSSLNFNTVGIDLSASGIDIAQKSFPHISFSRSSIYNFNDESLSGKFDIVTAIEVIEHLTHPKELLKQAKRYLKPKGHFIITMSYHGYLKNFAISALNLWDRHFSADQDSGHIKFFSVKSLKAMLIKEGFTNFKFYFAGRLPYLWKDMICVCQNELFTTQ